MPTISQLPVASEVTAADTIPISQNGTLRSVSVGTLLATTQPAISLETGDLLGRNSLGAGAPEQVSVGIGLNLSNSTVCATGLDHAQFPVAGTLDLSTDLVASNVGSPILLPVQQLRNLFAAGANISIDPSGTISASAIVGGGTSDVITNIAGLQTTSQLSAGDLLPVSQSGVVRSIAYANLLDGLTIDQAQAAAAVSDTDTLWVAQSSNLMGRQTFSAIWAWLGTKLPNYLLPSIEVTGSLSLDPSAHNGRILICSQAATISLGSSLPSGFNCTIFNVSPGNVSFSAGFLNSTGTNSLTPGQAAEITAISYSAGSIVYLSIPSQPGASGTPGLVNNLTATAANSSSINVTWQAPANAAGALTYLVQYRITGSSGWITAGSNQSSTTCQITNLTANTSYDITVQASNASGVGPYSNLVTVITPSSSQISAPPQVTGLSATAVSSTSIQLTWSLQSAATAYTVQYRVTGSSTWTGSVSGVTLGSATITGLQSGTSYDFSVAGTNGAGTGTASAIAMMSTPAAPSAVSSIVWNVPPGGPYSKGFGTIGVNVHVTPSAAPVQFGASQSLTVAPASWTTGTYVNTDLWGAYVPTPATAGSWYMWAEGTDGSAPTVYPTPFTVQ